jgi:hypothetical protein
VIIGNPPFLGGKLLISSLGEDYVYMLFARYDGRVLAEADLVCYWYAKAREQLEAGKCRRVGLVATNSIRGGANRRVLDAIRERSVIIDAWDDEAWVVEGAAVRVPAAYSWVRHRLVLDEGVQGGEHDGPDDTGRWPADLADEEILARLFELNQARSGAHSAAAA